MYVVVFSNCDTIEDTIKRIATKFLNYIISASAGSNQIGSADLTVMGDDEAEVFDLSFTFDFYGTDYDEIGVSTNGLVWLGDNDSTSPPTTTTEYDCPLPRQQHLTY